MPSLRCPCRHRSSLVFSVDIRQSYLKIKGWSDHVIALVLLGAGFWNLNYCLHTIRGGRPSAYYLYIFGMTSKSPPKASNILATPIENVEDSRAQRLQRQQSRFRDRGGRVSSP